MSGATDDEFMFVALGEMLAIERGISSKKTAFLHKHPEIVRALAASVVPLAEDIMMLATIEPVLAGDASEMLRLVAAHGLLPRGRHSRGGHEEGRPACHRHG